MAAGRKQERCDGCGLLSIWRDPRGIVRRVIRPSERREALDAMICRRKGAGISQQHLALAAGIDPANLSKIERGRRVFGEMMRDVLSRTLTRLERNG